ncbi:hypothetical protein HDU67_003842 [Dinochytrium kinnereticum]|nr:hypothetical protein HDU67_003842 [Dinochytrium kinnereticum]
MSSLDEVGVVTEPTEESRLTLDGGAHFEWTTPSGWDHTQPSSYFPQYSIQINCTLTSSPFNSIQFPMMNATSGSNISNYTRYFYVGTLGRLRFTPGSWDITISALCLWDREQVAQLCPGVNPMNCRPCSGFFPRPALGRMTILPSTASPDVATSTTIISSSSLPTAGPATTTGSAGPINPNNNNLTPSSANNSPVSSSSSLSPAAIGGIAAACILVAALAILLPVLYHRRRSSSSHQPLKTLDTSRQGAIGAMGEPSQPPQEELDFMEAGTPAAAPPPSYDRVASVTANQLDDGGSSSSVRWQAESTAVNEKDADKFGKGRLFT